MKKNLKKENGIAASDGILAILILTLFTGVISSLLYNIYLYNTSLKRMSKANGYIIDIAEHVEKTYYDDVTEEEIIDYFNQKYYNNKSKTEVKAQKLEDNTQETPFIVKIDVQKYNETEGNEDKLDLVKQVTITTQYKLGNKLQEIKIKKPKKRENLTTPNKPNLNLLKLQQGQVAYPVKEIDDGYVVCNLNDSNWYNYNNDKYAIVAIVSNTTQLKEGDKIEELNNTIYKWIPKNATNSEGDIKYLYSNTNKYIEEQNGYKKLVDIGQEYSVDSSFGNNEGKWEKLT